MSPTLRNPAIDAALSTAATLLGMEVVFVGRLDETTFTFDRIRGEWPGMTEGSSTDRDATMCQRMLDGAPPWTSDAAHDPAYADAPLRAQYGITSYVGVPIRDGDGTVLGTLCGIDHSAVPHSDATIAVLRDLAAIVAVHLAEAHPGSVVIRRTPEGWHVDGEDVEDLSGAMVLADLLQEDLAPARRPAKTDEELDEVARLRLAVSQLEHALAARVTVEQAIGVLAERLSLPPREAFERLRKVARRNGIRVHDLAREVVVSVTEPRELPDEITLP